MPNQKIKSPAREGLQNEGGYSEFAKYWEEKELTEQEGTLMRAKLDKSIKHSLELGIKGFTDISLGYCPAKIQDIHFEEDQFLVTVSIPFLLPPISQEAPYGRRDMKRIRKRFAMHLKKKEKQLSNLLYTELVHFLVRDQRSENLNPAIKKYLLDMSQRNFAGRPTRVIPAKTLGYIRDQWQSIKNTILAIQSRVRAMKKCNKALANDAVLEMLRSEYPSSAYPGISEFLEMGRLPRRRYLKSSMSPDPGKLRSCGLSEPEHWWISEIVPRVIQAKLNKETNIRYPLSKIRPLLKSK